MSNRLTGDDIGMLVALVRQQVKKQQKAIDRFTPRAGQDPADAESLLAYFHRQQDFRRGVLRKLLVMARAAGAPVEPGEDE